MVCMMPESRMVHYIVWESQSNIWIPWETLALLGVRHLISPRWLGDL